jgi:hypothetical protein
MLPRGLVEGAVIIWRLRRGWNWYCKSTSQIWCVTARVDFKLSNMVLYAFYKVGSNCLRRKVKLELFTLHT